MSMSSGASFGSVASLRTIAVWPLWQRLLHGALGLGVLVALVTHEGGLVHETVGYAALGAAAVRLVLALRGPAAARFSAFLRGPSATLAYALLLLQRREPRHLNHNPLGAWMVLWLLVLGLLAAGSGALYVTDRFWGEAWVIGLHAAAGWALLPLVFLHVAGVVHASLRHRENLATAMWHGRKPAPHGEDVTLR